jgi:glucose/arabinose dehydrogenase
MHSVRALVACAAVAGLLAGCSEAADTAPPTWEPSPILGIGGQGPGAQASPIVPLPSGSPGVGGPGGNPAPGGGRTPTPSPGTTKPVDPNVVATHLTAPVGLAMMPDGSALVGERTTGRIVQVQPQPGQPVPTVRTLHGLDGSGDGGLLDLALSPTFDEDGLVYAYVTTPTDNRVVDFTLKGPVTPVITGIPKGRTGNTGRIVFGWDGDLYIGTGDAGHPHLAADPHSLAGKVLRVDPIGDPDPDNPDPSSPVFTSGHQAVDGLCVLPQTRWLVDVEPGAGREAGEVNLLGNGDNYGWPRTQAGAIPPLSRLPANAGTPGGCAFVDGRLWVTSLAGQELLNAPIQPGILAPSTGPFAPVLKHRYGRLRTVVAASDGALWLTTSNRDGHGNPVPDDERVIRYLPTLGGGRSRL